MKKINIKNEFVFSIFFILIVLFSVLSFQKYFLTKDYLIFAETSCNPLEEQCFIGHCDPEYEECTGGEEDIFYYKKAQRLARFIPLCDPEEEECFALACNENELECSEVFCNPDDEELECSIFNE